MISENSISVQNLKASALEFPVAIPKYGIIFTEDKIDFSIDVTSFHSEGRTLICFTPFQHFEIKSINTAFTLLTFTGDFYCIEYHKKEVACNGLLFNAIYQQPFFEISKERSEEIRFFMEKIQHESTNNQHFSEAIVKSYLQLILAIASAEKSALLTHLDTQYAHHPMGVLFQELLETHFIQHRNIDFYAEKLGLSPNHFSRKIKQHFGKNPSQFIQERLTLEAKKSLHLTHKSIKQIAHELKFDDEFYFSRFFKKQVGVSPLHYREHTGISEVANLSM